jgi:hypothetical protein
MYYYCFFNLILASSIERKITLIDNACFKSRIITKSYDSIENKITLTDDACSRPPIIIKSYGLHVVTLEEM